MTDHMEYRIVCNGAIKEYGSAMPTDEFWKSRMDIAEERNYNIKMQRRFICNDDDGLFWAGLTNKTGVIRIKNLVIMPWETIAECIRVEA